MPPDTQVVPQGTENPNPAGAAPPPPANQPTEDPLPQGTAPAPNGGVQILSSSAYKEIKQKARERGQKEALAEFAKSIGFESPDEIKAALGQLKKLTATNRPSNKPNGNGNGQRQPQGQRPNVQNARAGTDPKVERRLQELENEKLEAKKDARIAKAKLREVQLERDNREIEMALRQQALLAGAKSDKAVNYLISAFVQEMEGKSEEELAKIDEAKWFADRRKEEPYLFGEVVKPATTGTGTGGAPAPTAGAAAGAAAQSGKIDAMKMTKVEYRDYLAKRGLNTSM